MEFFKLLLSWLNTNNNESSTQGAIILSVWPCHNNHHNDIGGVNSILPRLIVGLLIFMYGLESEVVHRIAMLNRCLKDDPSRLS